eukprot:1911655-Pleurochrysis_carterae.AAC.2
MAALTPIVAVPSGQVHSLSCTMMVWKRLRVSKNVMINVNDRMETVGATEINQSLAHVMHSAFKTAANSIEVLSSSIAKLNSHRIQKIKKILLGDWNPTVPPKETTLNLHADDEIINMLKSQSMSTCRTCKAQLL